MLALKLIACLVACWLTYRFIVSAKPTTSETDNPFLKKRDKQEVKRPNYVYRLAREAEPTRNATGEVDEGSVHGRTIGAVAAFQVSLPVEQRMVGTGGYFGVPETVDSQCLHLSTADQVPSTCKLYFEGVEDLLLLKFTRTAITKDESIELKWEEVRPHHGTHEHAYGSPAAHEPDCTLSQAQPRPGRPARKGDFPHVYSPWGKSGRRIAWWCLKSCTKLPQGPDGERIFPEGCFSEDVDD